MKFNIYHISSLAINLRFPESWGLFLSEQKGDAICLPQREYYKDIIY